MLWGYVVKSTSLSGATSHGLNKLRPSSAPNEPVKDEGPLTLRQRITFIRGHLLVYMCPLFLVYFSEYAMQSGTWAAIGFPVTSESSRKEFYQQSNWIYQAGVFVSRSSGSLVQASMPLLQAMPVLQTVLLILFYCIAYYQFLYHPPLLLSLCFLVGLLGGAVYVNAFTRISTDIPKRRQELALATVSVADSTGIMLSDVAGLFIQSCLYRRHGIEGAKVTCFI